MGSHKDGGLVERISVQSVPPPGGAVIEVEPACEAVPDECSRVIARDDDGEAAFERPRVPVTVLVIDPDAVSRRFVEIALGRQHDVRLVAALDGASALEVLAATRVHLILAESELHDMNGIQLLRRLIQETRLRQVPFVFLTADARASTKRAAFAAGADDFLAKPCDGDVLATRVRGLIAREQRAAAERRARTPGLAGQFSELCFADLLSLLEQGQRSGTISIACADATGVVHVDGGRVVHAVFGNLIGPAALGALMREEQGHFELAPGSCGLGRDERTISESSNARLTHARSITAEYFVYPPDGALGAPVHGAMTSTYIDAAARGHSPSPPTLIPAYLPDTGSAAQIEQSIQDGFALGDLMSFTDDDLSRWTAATPARDRFHVLLVADLSQGVSSMLTLAGSPTEDWILRSLSPKPKAVGLSFFLRRERLLDVVLIDIRAPGAFAKCLGRVPSVLIVAPAGGDASSIGLKARLEIAELIARLSPPALLVVGNPLLKKAFRPSGGGIRSEMAVRCLASALGEPGADLRTVLVESIRLCAGTER